MNDDQKAAPALASISAAVPALTIKLYSKDARQPTCSFNEFDKLLNQELIEVAEFKGCFGLSVSPADKESKKNQNCGVSFEQNSVSGVCRASANAVGLSVAVYPRDPHSGRNIVRSNYGKGELPPVPSSAMAYDMLLRAKDIRDRMNKLKHLNKEEQKHIIKQPYFNSGWQSDKKRKKKGVVSSSSSSSSSSSDPSFSSSSSSSSSSSPSYDVQLDLAVELKKQCYSLAEYCGCPKGKHPHFLPRRPNKNAPPRELFYYWKQAVLKAESEVRKKAGAAPIVASAKTEKRKSAMKILKKVAAGERGAKGKVCSRQSYLCLTSFKKKVPLSLSGEGRRCSGGGCKKGPEREWRIRRKRERGATLAFSTFLSSAWPFVVSFPFTLSLSLSLPLSHTSSSRRPAAAGTTKTTKTRRRRKRRSSKPL